MHQTVKALLKYSSLIRPSKSIPKCTAAKNTHLYTWCMIPFCFFSTSISLRCCSVRWCSSGAHLLWIFFNYHFSEKYSLTFYPPRHLDRNPRSRPPTHHRLRSQGFPAAYGYARRAPSGGAARGGAGPAAREPGIFSPFSTNVPVFFRAANVLFLSPTATSVVAGDSQSKRHTK